MARGSGGEATLQPATLRRCMDGEGMVGPEEGVGGARQTGQSSLRKAVI